MTNYRLAIVIPLYKANFLVNALDSIANQSNKNFTVYIGDDCSPHELFSIVKDYENRLNIVYKRFPFNFGGKDLISHWERCIDMVHNEEWIWLFSDDDIMSSNCVDNFYNTLANNPDHDLFHFNMQLIDENGLPISGSSSFSKAIKVEEFLLLRLQYKTFSSVVEYVFRKEHFIKMGRFQKFDLAWCSDDATWIKLGKRNGIININDAIVYWRYSTINISSIHTERDILERKLYAQVEFIKWIYLQSKNNSINIEINKLENQLKYWFFISLKGKIKYINFLLLTKLIFALKTILIKKYSALYHILYLYSYKLYCTFFR